MIANCSDRKGSTASCHTIASSTFFETKRYDWLDSEDELKKVQDSIVKLALLLNAPKHPSFHTLSCFGVLAEESACQYLFLYRWPEENRTRSVPEHYWSIFPAVTNHR